jgi:hypothetical protein
MEDRDRYIYLDHNLAPWSSRPTWFKELHDRPILLSRESPHWLRTLQIIVRQYEASRRRDAVRKEQSTKMTLCQHSTQGEYAEDTRPDIRQSQADLI